MKLSNKSGFSLVELMVVVAIIGILATIAVPNFQRFQAKSRQSEARTNLAGLFTSQRAFFSEYGTYHANLRLTGYVPDGVTWGGAACNTMVENQGSRRYSVGFGTDGAGNAATASNVGGLVALPCTGPSFGLTVAGTDSNKYDAATGAAAATAFPATSAATGTPALQPAAATFLAGAQGDIGGTPGVLDEWNMTHNKILTNSRNGID